MDKMSIVKRGRHLQQDSDVFQFNAWDDVIMEPQEKQEAELKLKQQEEQALAQEPGGLDSKRSLVESEQDKKWNDFYTSHQDNFFKDRKWLFSEFPELLPVLEPTAGPCNILELGCGVGNTIMPILTQNRNPHLSIFACDLSNEAVRIFKNHSMLLDGQPSVGRLVVFQKDITTEWTDVDPPPPAAIDFILSIFCLSAVPPNLMGTSLQRITSRYLRDNGMILLRDYARYDMAQLRFRPRSYLGDSYYYRGDGTTSYFFSEEQLHELLSKYACLVKIKLVTDRRLLCNRAKSLKMFRCWIQAKYKKCEGPSDLSDGPQIKI